MFAVLLVLSLVLVSVLLIAAQQRVPSGRERTVELILDALPQTQCGQCGYAGCQPYARAIAAGEVDINQCPPGGAQTISRLANLLGIKADLLDLKQVVTPQDSVAIIDEDACIGCVKCIQVCPTDAIIGAAKQMHTIIDSECTGCGLCIAPCPMDCIKLMTVSG